MNSIGQIQQHTELFPIRINDSHCFALLSHVCNGCNQDWYWGARVFSICNLERGMPMKCSCVDICDRCCPLLRNKFFPSSALSQWDCKNSTLKVVICCWCWFIRSLFFFGVGLLVQQVLIWKIVWYPQSGGRENDQTGHNLWNFRYHESYVKYNPLPFSFEDVIPDAVFLFSTFLQLDTQVSNRH